MWGVETTHLLWNIYIRQHPLESNWKLHQGPRDKKGKAGLIRVWTSNKHAYMLICLHACVKTYVRWRVTCIHPLITQLPPVTAIDHVSPKFTSMYEHMWQPMQTLILYFVEITEDRAIKATLCIAHCTKWKVGSHEEWRNLECFHPNQTAN